MVMEILSGRSGNSVLFARYAGGGFCPRQQKRVGGGFCPGGFCPTLIVNMRKKHASKSTPYRYRAKIASKETYFLCLFFLNITVTCPCNEYSLKPHFYIKNRV